ncbi:Uridine kinase [Pelagirhabdus alkalitolerans]|uniref:Uridine kinase n=1 Tax=Pelagirhabdus alkalitolerans TaxID=1612202 RepID=A0A1G6J3S6_9BACI|nr:AAA family ATPase [Pelagirhabdus alkalitolerans]SDC12626.1 Uridine kinase [Pelagirhabdus alkalitolerans]
MEKEKTPLVVAIAGVSGGGKTTITNYLNDKLINSKVISFDDYDFDGPYDIIDWIDNGANYNEWNLDPLIQDIKMALVEPLDYILLDYPFAYKHMKTSTLIDLTIYIDTPLDIAMARRLIRDYKNSSTENILFDMENYISRGRRGYLEMLKTIKPNSDIIVDGTLSVSKIINEIYNSVSDNNTNTER